MSRQRLNDSGTSYAPNADLPALYNAVSKGLGLAPSKHTEKIFKQILGGCQAMVEGLGRSETGSATPMDTASQRKVRPGARHAELAVNLAGAMAMFLLAAASAVQSGE